MSTLGERIDQARALAGGWSPTELARRSGVSAEVISKIRSGARGERVSAEIAMKLAHALGVEMVWLVDGSGDMWRKPTEGRVALERALTAMVWPTPTSVEAADQATRLAKREADDVGIDRAESVWVIRLRQLYDEAIAIPAGAAEPTGLADSPRAKPRAKRPSVRTHR